MPKRVPLENATKRPLRLLLTFPEAEPDLLPEARLIYEHGAGQTNSYELLGLLVKLCRDEGREIDMVRYERHKDGSRHEVHFDLEETEIVLREQIEVRPTLAKEP